MGRGGKRPGAGRPVGSSVLDAWEQIAVGVECQRRWREDLDRRLAEKQQEYFSRSDYHAAVARYRQSGLRDSEALEDVEYSRCEMAQMNPEDPSDGPRLIHFQAPRPYRLRNRVLREVSQWASQRFGKQVSVGVVRSAWEIQRAVERDASFD